MKILTGHLSPETAFVVEDYPYGFRLRCKKRYWLDYNVVHGVRMVTQTSNPKKPGLVWNAPKLGVYSHYGAAMYLDDEGHVQVAGLSEYSDGKQAAEFRDKFGAGVPEAVRDLLNRWVAAKVAYDANRTKGDPLSGLPEARAAFLAKPTEQ